MKITVSDLRSKILNLLSNVNKEDADIIADYLLYAEMSGNKTQGIIKLSGTNPLQDIIPSYGVKIIRETKVSGLLDAGKNAAIVASYKGADMAIKKAKEMGISIIGVKNIFSSNGAQAYYVEKIANEGLIGIMVSRSPGSVAVFNSIDPLFGTNPIGFAFPTNEEPIVFDAATSAITFYGLIVANARGEKLPENIAIDKDGNFTTDPGTVIKDGAIMPFGNSYKAAGFSMLVELLAGPLIGGAFLDYKTFDQEWGTTIIAIDPTIFGDLQEFKNNCSNFVSIIKSSRTKDGESIRFPNETARNKFYEAQTHGFVEIDEVIFNKIFK